MANPQKENGHTQIANEILEAIIATRLNGTELAIILHIFRKTYGFHKKQDEISLTQFEKALNSTRPAIVRALKKLQNLKIIQLIKKGNCCKNSNLWKFNKDYDSWLTSKQNVTSKQIVTSKQNITSTSKQNDKSLVNKTLHTKERLKKDKDIYMTDLDFDQFWNLYPKKTGKGGARNKFEKIERRLLLTIMDALKTICKKDWKTKDKKYIPHPLTWLNQQRWEDEVEEEPMVNLYKTALAQNDNDPDKADFTFTRLYREQKGWESMEVIKDKDKQVEIEEALAKEKESLGIKHIKRIIK